MRNLEKYGIYSFDQESRPAIIVIDRVVQIYDVYYRWRYEELKGICLDYGLVYSDLESFVNDVKLGVHTIMIDLPQYRAALAKNEE